MIMNARRPSVLQSKVVAAYTKLLQSPIDDPAFYTDLLALAVDREFLEGELNNLPTEAFLGPLKPSLNALFRACFQHASRNAPHNDTKRHALETLSILSRCILSKTPPPTGWEVMEIMAGGVTQSDTIFLNLTGIINELSDSDLPVDIRHQILQFALIFMCGVGQLSPGAYFLRRDLFPSIVSFIKAPETERYTFEAILLLSVLANFHKSKQNIYLQHIIKTEDTDLMRKVCWASNFALDAVVKSYQEISDDDTSQTLAAAFGSMMSKLRPDRALAPADPPRELFKSQPIEACVVLLPVFEFLKNPTFPLVLISPSDQGAKSRAISSPPYTIISLSSYLLTHASSTSSPRAIVYANLCLNTLLALVEKPGVLIAFSQPSDEHIRLCRQRLPLLPVPPSRRPPLCAVLDCCVLWLRHNLHKRLEVQSYTTCIWVCYRVIWFLHKAHIRLEYSWQELWSAIIGLLGFLSSKLDSLATTGGVEQLVRATILLLDMCLAKCEVFLPAPEAVHLFVYELVRSSSTLSAQLSLLKMLALPEVEPRAPWRRTSWITEQPAETLLLRLLSTTEFYQNKIAEANASSANRAMRVVATEIDREGLQGMKDARETEPPGEVAEVALSRFVCSDVLALMQ